MATVTDVEVANASFPNVRQDLNDILEALATNFSADAEPSTMYANQFWYETDTNLLKFRNEDNDAWITLAYFDQTADEWEVRSAVMQAVDAAGLAFKTDEGTTRLSISDAGQVSFQNYSFPTADGTSGQVLTTDGAGNLSFGAAAGGDSISEGNSSVEVVDTGTGYVVTTVDGTEKTRITPTGLGVSTNSPSHPLHVLATAAGQTTVKFESNQAGSMFVALDVDTDRDCLLQFQEAGTTRWDIFMNGSSGTNPLLIRDDDGTTQGSFDQSGNFKFNSGYGSAVTAYGCRAWVNFNGTGTVASRGSGNVSSVGDIGTGVYRVNFSTSMPDANYAVVTYNNATSGTGVGNFANHYGGGAGDRTTAKVDVRSFSGSDVDAELFDVIVLR